MQPVYDLIDTHAHLEHDAFRDDVEDVIRRAAAARVAYMIIPACDAQDARRALALALTYDEVYVAAGLHPNNGTSLTGEQRRVLTATLREGVLRGKAVAVGECGLDYHYLALPAEEQRAILRWHLGLARELDLPVILHQRDAAADLRQILDEEGVPPRGGVLHCFGSDEEYYSWARERGLLVSFTGSITFQGGRPRPLPPLNLDLRRTMIETDAPYMAPHPHRGRRNEPSYLPLIAAALAVKLDRPREDVAALTTLAARELFRLPPAFGGAVAYPFKRALYLNVTNRCSNDCVFCLRRAVAGVGGHNLRLRMEPTVAEVRAAVGDPRGYDEIVFCGFGEPTLRWDEVIALARDLKAAGARVRLNTNGSANLSQGRDVTPEMAGAFDAVSISLVAADAENYARLCRPRHGRAAWDELARFVLGARRYVPRVEVSGVAGIGVEESALAALAHRWGVPLRMRPRL